MGGKYEIIEVDYGDPEPTNLRMLPDNADLNYKKAVDSYIWNGHRINRIGQDMPSFTLLREVIGEFGPFHTQCVYLFDKQSDLFKIVRKSLHLNIDEHNVILIPNDLGKTVSKDTFDTFKDFVGNL
jgi:hypothetical protein